jgi:hypothetical protein
MHSGEHTVGHGSVSLQPVSPLQHTFVIALALELRLSKSHGSLSQFVSAFAAVRRPQSM